MHGCIIDFVFYCALILILIFVEGDDFTNNGPFVLTFNRSNQVAQVRVPLTNDSVYELTETFTAGLSFVSSVIPLVTFSPNEATVTIRDDESKYCDNKDAILLRTLYFFL